MKKRKKKKVICDRCNFWHQRLFVVYNDGKEELICRKCVAELVGEYLPKPSTGIPQ